MSVEQHGQHDFEVIYQDVKPGDTLLGTGVYYGRRVTVKWIDLPKGEVCVWFPHGNALSMVTDLDEWLPTERKEEEEKA